MQEKTYTELYNTIKALAGVGSFTTEEQADILNFVNRRAYTAYHASSVWPRFIVVGEQRTIVSSPAQTIEWTESGKNNIGEFIRIHRTQPFLNLSACEFEYYVDSSGAHIINISTADSTSAYVTYKKELADYTTSSTDIPLEWFEYLAHAAYADFLRMDGQLEKAMMEEIRAQEYLDWSLEKAQSRANNSTIGKRFTTYVTRQRR